MSSLFGFDWSFEYSILMSNSPENISLDTDFRLSISLNLLDQKTFKKLNDACEYVIIS